MEKTVFYGTRGSSSLTSSKYVEFGGATTCIMLNLGNTHIMVDCGSGVNNALDDLKDIDELHLFISHSHIDHICGIPMLFGAMDGKKLHIWGKTFDGVSIEDSINRIMCQSLWPVRINTYKNITFHTITGDVTVGDVTVQNMDSNHVGGCSLFRFNFGSDSIVTAFDFCHLDDYESKLCDFANGCSTLIYDGNMTEEELQRKPDWGHSTPEAGARIGAKVDAKTVYITHFGVYDDNFLSEWESRIRAEYHNVVFARSGQRKDELRQMVDIGNLLSAEKDSDTLLSHIVNTSMDITGADGGTLYLLDGDKLEFKVMINRSMHTKLIKRDEPLNIPSVDIQAKNVCATAAREKKLINVADCHSNTDYDFSGVIKYDTINHYNTKSVLVIPLTDEYTDVVGVLQLINAQDVSGEIVSFRKQDEDILMALANQASMSIKNAFYSSKINDLLYGFVKVMSLGIDERTPYNANHTRNMVSFADRFFDFEESCGGKYSVDDKKRREILLSIWLHDIGKILTPMDIMNKDTRLGTLTETVKIRFDRRELLLKLQYAEGKLSETEYNEAEAKRISQQEAVKVVNTAGFLTPELKAIADALATETYTELDGSQCPIITPEEHYQLSIVKGTLNREERNIMEGHVSLTQRFLSQLNFPKYYDCIPMYAGNHHEFLNGTGYPNHLTEKDLPWPCRLITVCDIFEALIAKDRPYKKPMPVEKALSILHEMASNGQLDAEIVDEFEKSKVW